LELLAKVLFACVRAVCCVMGGEGHSPQRILYPQGCGLSNSLPIELIMLRYNHWRRNSACTRAVVRDVLECVGV
jgi:hypothetical protein